MAHCQDHWRLRRQPAGKPQDAKSPVQLRGYREHVHDIIDIADRTAIATIHWFDMGSRSVRCQGFCGEREPGHKARDGYPPESCRQACSTNPRSKTSPDKSRPRELARNMASAATCGSDTRQAPASVESSTGATALIRMA